jgi:hypothetical protein
MEAFTLSEAEALQINIRKKGRGIFSSSKKGQL